MKWPDTEDIGMGIAILLFLAFALMQIAMMLTGGSFSYPY